MKYVIELSTPFKREFKRLLKKYRSLDSDLERLAEELRAKPDMGVDLGNGVRKVRMAITAKGKGKSHGARVITFTAVVSELEGVITLLTIYDKADKDSVSDKEISELISGLL